MKAYQTYRKSGVPWLDTIPATWKLAPIKRIFAEVNEKKGEQSYPLLSFSREKGLIISAEDKKGIPDDLSCYKILKKGQLLENRMQAWNGMFICADKDGCVSPDYSVFKAISTTNTSVKFYEYVFRNITWVNLFANASKGIGSGFNRLYTPQFGAIKTIIPSLEEQNAIVTYLDKKCTEIDELVSRRQAIIERLKELKQSIIAEAVTKGLNPDVPMKDSGVKWLGHIPAHWETKYPKALFALRKSRAAKGEKQLTSSQHHGVIYQEDYMRLTGNRIVTVLKDFDILKHVEAGDFVISMRSFQGGIEYSPYTGSISSAYVMLIPNRDYVHPAYFKWLLKSHGYIKALQSTSNLVRDGQAMRYANFVQVRLPYLPMAEQESIAHHLDKKCAEIDALISRQEQIIEKLKELKTSTIAHVVTGKVDVRDTL